MQLAHKVHLKLKKLQPKSVHEIKLKHCLHYISTQLGFTTWHHAQAVLSGKINKRDNCDMGAVFANAGSVSFVNLWFSSYSEAQQFLSNAAQEYWLLPYKTQFMLVKREYMSALHICDTTLSERCYLERDLFVTHNTPLWDKLAYEVIRQRN